MNLRAAKYYYIIKINRIEQNERREKIGSIYIPANFVFMTRNMQSGEIVSIGEKCKQAFPEARVGQFLLCHHFIEDAEFYIGYDKQYNYYAVPGVDITILELGRNEFGEEKVFEKVKTPNRTYGIWDGRKIIPHPDYLFLKKGVPEARALPVDKIIDESVQNSSGGLLVFKEWRETTQEKIEKMEKLKKEAETLAHTGTTNRHVMRAIEEKEAEARAISDTLNQKKFIPYAVAYAPHIVSQWCDTQIEDGSILYMYNLACQTEVEVMKTNYIVALTKHIGFAWLNEKTA